MRTSLMIVACFALALPAAAEDVSVSGCVEPGVEAGCLMMKAGDELYNVTHAKPKPEIGKYGTVMGTLSDGVDICQQGKIVDPST